MTLKIGFAQGEQMTAQVYAQRLRICAALGGRVQLSMTPDEARSLAADLDRMVAGAEVYLAGEVRRIETEAAEAATCAAMAHMADQLTEMSQAAEAQYEAGKASAIRAFVVLSLTIAAILTVWGWF